MTQFLPRAGRVEHTDWMEALMLSRGLDSDEKRQRFLSPALENLSDAGLLPGAHAAAQVLRRLRDEKRTVAVYGDYDVDGVCAASIMEETLCAFGLDCFIYIPDRHEEGYGLNRGAIQALSHRCGAILTVDCGIVSVEDVRYARELGLAVIVTDHHRTGETLPPADAVVCPLLDGYPFPTLCGAGVAWKLCDLLMGRQFALGRLDLCALATVADVVPLVDENRILVRFGLEAIARTRRPGLLSLCRRAGVECRQVKSETIAYQLAPRLNAAGRLESAMDAVRLLRTGDEGEAESLSLKLERINMRRREAQQVVMAEAEVQVKEMDLTQLHAIVVLGENWDSGVVGLAAGKIAEKYAYPTVVLTRLEDGETCVGSARSAGQVDIHQALSACSDLFLRFGGHAAAAGMTLRCEDVDQLRTRLSRQVSLQLSGCAPVKTVVYDACMRLKDVHTQTIEIMEQLEPFGMGNPAPRFLFEQVELLVKRAVGAQGAHLKCTFRQDGEVRDGIAFGLGKLAHIAPGRLDMVAVPTLNRFQGRVSAECQVQDMRLLPLCLPDDMEGELHAVLQELRLIAENISNLAPDAGFAVVEQPPAAWVQAPQGTLLWCRRADTLRKWAQQYPQLPLLTDVENDPRAYTGLAVGLNAFLPRYRRVVLCDGLLCGEEAAYLKATYPETDFVSLASRTGAAMAAQFYVPIEELRDIYRALRVKGGSDTLSFAEEMGMYAARADAAFHMLCDMALAERVEYPGGIRLLPPVKSDAQKSPLYRLLENLKNP